MFLKSILSTKRRKLVASLALALLGGGGGVYLSTSNLGDESNSRALSRGSRSPDTSYYVSASGSGTDCSIGSPCLFSYIIQSSNPRGVLGGDTIFMRAGTYSGVFTVAISGTASASILIRNYASEAVVIDNSMNDSPAGLYITGSYVTIQGFDGPTKTITITNSTTDRIVESPLACIQNFLDPCRADGVYVVGAGIKLIHLIIRDGENGVVSFGNGKDLVMYGNILPYNGWQSAGDGLDRGHGHGSYMQNDSLTQRKSIEMNIFFWGFGYCTQLYGSDSAQVFGIDFDKNICFENGRIATSDTGSLVRGPLVGGNADAHDVTITDNIVVTRSLSDQARQDGIDPAYHPGTSNMTITGNFVRGGKAINYSTAITGTVACSDNTFIGTMSATATSQCPAGSGNVNQAFPGSSTTVIQRMSEYDATWGYLFIANPSGAASATWNPSGCDSGDQFELRDVMDWDGAALQTLACTAGRTVTMTNSVTPNAPVGSVPNSPVNTGNTYRVFVLTLIPGADVEITTESPLPGGTQNSAYSQALTCIGGTPPYAWDTSAGSLPAGLSLGAATGVISGTPSGTGESTFTARCTDDDMTAGTKPFSLTIAAAAAMSVTTTTLPNCPQNTAYSQPVNATGGVPPYTWTVFSGSLPTGLTLGSSSGVISGTCSGSVADASLVIRVTDTVMTTADSSALTLSVLPNTTVPITCYVTGNGRRKKLYCNAPGLPITQHMTATVFNSEGQEVDEVTSSGGPAERELILGQGQQLDVGSFSVLATSAGTTTEVEFSTATVGGTGSLLFVLPPAPNRGIDNVLIEYGTTESLGTSVEVSCSSTCLHSITGLTAGSVYFYRITWRDSMDATVMRGPIENAIIQ